MTQRTGWVDYGKGLGIILVVYAHLLSSGYHAGLPIQQHFFFLSDSIVYSFHMPLFFFLAGLFVSQSYSRRGSKQFIFSKLKLLAYPYLVWSFIQAGIELIFSQHSQRGIMVSDVMAIPYLPWSQFWFLYALLLMYVAYAIFHGFGKYAQAVMLLFSFAILFCPINTDIMALNGFSTGFIFFVSGILIRSKLKDLEKISIPAWSIFILFPVFLGSGYYIFGSVISPTRLIDGTHPLYFLYLAALGILLCIGLAQFLARTKILSGVKTLGMYSLQIYLVHMLVGVGTRIILEKLLLVQNPWLHILLGVSAGLVVPILIYKLSMKVNFPYLFGPGKSSAAVKIV